MLLRQSIGGARGIRPRVALINRDSPQALGLSGWWPTVGVESGMRDYVRGLDAVSQTNPALAVVQEQHGLAAHYDGSRWDLTGTIPYTPGGTTPFSMSIWTRSVAIGGVFPATDSTLWTIQDTATFHSGTADKALILTIFSQQNAVFYVYDGAKKKAQGTTNINDGRPYLLTGTFDGATASIYVNGRLEGATAASSSYGSYTDPRFVWGRANESPNDYYGELWDSRFYTRCLTAQDVWRMFDPATRWDLYGVPSSRTFFDMGTAVPDKVPYQPNYQWAPILAQ